MLTVQPQYITDHLGKKISVVLPVNDFKAIMDELEELEDIKLYDDAKKEDTSERILFSDYLKKRKAKNAKFLHDKNFKLTLWGNEALLFNFVLYDLNGSKITDGKF